MLGRHILLSQTINLNSVRQCTWTDTYKPFLYQKHPLSKKFLEALLNFLEALFHHSNFLLRQIIGRDGEYQGESLICVAIVFTQFYVNISRGSIKVSLRS